MLEPGGVLLLGRRETWRGERRGTAPSQTQLAQLTVSLTHTAVRPAGECFLVFFNIFIKLSNAKHEVWNVVMVWW